MSLVTLCPRKVAPWLVSLALLTLLGCDRGTAPTPPSAPGPKPTAPREPKPKREPPPKPKPPRDLPQPYPELRATGGGQPFAAGPVWRPREGIVADTQRSVIHAMRWPDELIALEPATGEVAYRHGEGQAPLAVVGNRLLALGEQRLWILDTHDGAPVYELPLPFLPSLADPDYRPSSVGVSGHAGNVVVVRVHVEREPDYDQRAYSELGDREAAAKQARTDLAKAQAHAKAEALDYAFAIDVEGGRVVACPPRGAREPISWNLKLAGVGVHFRSPHTARVKGGPQDWRLSTRRLFVPQPKAPTPTPLLPRPWPEPEAFGTERPFEPGPCYGQVGMHAVADPQRGVYHLLLDDALAAVDPESGERIYAHTEVGVPLAVVGNRLVVRGDQALWVFDTHDGAAVYRMASPQLAPLRDSARSRAWIQATHAQGPVVRLETWSYERPPPQPDGVERPPGKETRFAFGLDVSTGKFVAPPDRQRERLRLLAGKEVGRFRLEMWNRVARGRRAGDFKGRPLWELRVRDLKHHEPLKVEADDPPR